VRHPEIRQFFVLTSGGFVHPDKKSCLAASLPPPPISKRVFFFRPLSLAPSSFFEVPARNFLFFSVTPPAGCSLSAPRSPASFSLSSDLVVFYDCLLLRTLGVKISIRSRFPLNLGFSNTEKDVHFSSFIPDFDFSMSFPCCLYTQSVIRPLTPAFVLLAFSFTR